MSIRCPSCKAPLPDDVKPVPGESIHCPGCGASITVRRPPAPAVKEEEDSDVPLAIPAGGKARKGGSARRAARSARRSPAGAGFLLLAVGVTVFFALSGAGLALGFYYGVVKPDIKASKAHSDGEGQQLRLGGNQPR